MGKISPHAYVSRETGALPAFSSTPCHTTKGRTTTQHSSLQSGLKRRVIYCKGSKQPMLPSSCCRYSATRYCQKTTIAIRGTCGVRISTLAKRASTYCTYATEEQLWASNMADLLESSHSDVVGEQDLKDAHPSRTFLWFYAPALSRERTAADLHWLLHAATTISRKASSYSKPHTVADDAVRCCTRAKAISLAR